MDHSLSILSDSHNDVAELPHPEARGRRSLVSITSLAIGTSSAMASDHHMDAVLIPNTSPSFQQSFAWAHLFGQSPEHETTPLAKEPGNKGSVVLFWHSGLEAWELPSKTLEKYGAMLQRFRTCTNGRSPPAEKCILLKRKEQRMKVVVLSIILMKPLGFLVKASLHDFIWVTKQLVSSAIP